MPFSLEPFSRCAFLPLCLYPEYPLKVLQNDFWTFFCIFCRAVNPFLFNYWVHPSVSLNVLGFLTNKRPALKTALRLCQRLPKLELLSFQLTWNCKLPICSPKLPSKCDMPPSGCKNPDAELIVIFLPIGKLIWIFAPKMLKLSWFSFIVWMNVWIEPLLKVYTTSYQC